jgi:glycosyltransferase involved in cell wall biosynthesis
VPGKLIIQIPCFNEELTLPPTVKSLPRSVEGFDKVEWLVIDDGSSDRTVEIARELGVDHIVRHNRNRGLAHAFVTGLEASLQAGADVIVNTDGDNQYNADDIPKLVAPINSGEADVVIGTRPVDTLGNYTLLKRVLHRLGRYLLRLLSGADIPDPPSGFRALSRDAAERMNVFSGYTYTLETILQAGSSGLMIKSVPIRTNIQLRGSRLIRNLPRYVLNAAATALHTAVIYHPGTAFLLISLFFVTLGVALGVRFLFFYVAGSGVGHVQSLILCALLIGLGVLLLVVGVLADLIAVNRKLLENIHRELRGRRSRT